MHVHADWLPKRGNTAEEYEDAFAGNPRVGRFAVADGATESVFAGSWARLLVEQFIQGPECEIAEWVAWVPSVQARWSEGISGRSLPWYAEMKVQQGAFATFLGVQVAATRDRGFAWRAIAVGDTCLFHTRSGELLGAFPIEHSGRFENSPPLVGSRTPPQTLRERAVQASGTAITNDRLWLMSDAMAQWFLLEHEAGNRPWEPLEQLLTLKESESVFASWIEGLRDAKRIRNDDVTLLAISL